MLLGEAGPVDVVAAAEERSRPLLLRGAQTFLLSLQRAGTCCWEQQALLFIVIESRGLLLRTGERCMVCDPSNSVMVVRCY